MNEISRKTHWLAQAIVDYEMVGYYDLIDAYDTPENALECIIRSLSNGDINLADLCYDYNQTILHENLSDDAKELARRVVSLADDLAWDRFVTMVNTYRALGYRIVAFERECEGGWIMAFDTHGKDATEFPKEAFDIPECRQWCKDYGWDSVTDDDVLIFDQTDDVDFIYDSYDYFANFPVMQLVSDYR